MAGEGRKDTKRKPSQLYKSYDGAKSKNKFCPKCGSGVFMAQHKDRMTCGKCHYMEKL